MARSWTIDLRRLRRRELSPTKGPTMKKALLTIITGLLTTPVFAADDWKHLFNGKDLTGLKVQFEDKDKDADPAKTFTVKEEALIVSGKPKCYIYTDKSYKNYELTY